MTRRLYRPRSTEVSAGPDGVPLAVGGAEVEAVREEWLVADRWWTSRPLRRRYFELIMQDGVNTTVFCELANERWYVQKGA
jgi:hypothetical protein